MIFVDTNVFVYAVGREHPLRAPARDFFAQAAESGLALCTSAEVLQELLHIYLPVGRESTLDAALELVRMSVREVVDIRADDVLHARALVRSHARLGARDLIHLATCSRCGVERLQTFDRRLADAFTAMTPSR